MKKQQCIALVQAECGYPNFANIKSIRKFKLAAAFPVIVGAGLTDPDRITVARFGFDKGDGAAPGNPPLARVIHAHQLLAK